MELKLRGSIPFLILSTVMHSSGGTYCTECSEGLWKFALEITHDIMTQKDDKDESIIYVWVYKIIIFVLGGKKMKTASNVFWRICASP
jgi:hypothetical protein